MKGAIALIGIVVVGVLVAGMSGVVNIPGLTPAKKPAQATAPNPAKLEPPKKKRVKRPQVSVVKRAPSSDPLKGEAAVAQLWENLSTDSLVAIAKDWKDAELAKILLKMDSEKVSAFLEKIEAARASKLTRAIQKEAARVLQEASKR